MFSKKWIISTFIALSLLPLLAQFFLQSPFLTEQIKSRVEKQLKQILQKELLIGDIEVRLFSNALLVKEIVIQSDSALLPASLAVKELKISFSPASFFKETLLIREMTIDSPTLLWKAPNHFDPRPEQAETESAFALLQGRGVHPPPVMIRLIRLKSGSVSYEGDNALKEISLVNVSAKIRPNPSMSHFEIDLDNGEGAYLLDEMSGNISQLTAKVLIQPEKLIIKRATLVSNHGRLETNGVVKFKEPDPLDLQIDLSLPLASIDLSQSDRDRSSNFFETLISGFREKNVSGDIRFVGRLRGDYPNISVEGISHLEQLKLGGEALASAEARLLYHNGAISIPAFSGRVFSGRFSGAAEININPILKTDEARKGPALFVIALNVSDLPLSRIKGLNLHTEEPAFHDISVSGNLLISDMGITEKPLQAKGQLLFERHALFSPPLSKQASPLIRLGSLLKKGTFGWDFSRGRFNFTQGVLLFPDTTLRFSGHWENSTGLTLDTRLDSTEIQKLAETLPIPLKGRSHIHGTLKLRPEKEEAAPEFTGTVTLENWTILNQAFAKLNTGVEVQGKQIQFKQGHLKGRISKNAVHLHIPSSDILFEGKLDLNDLKSPRFSFLTRLKTGNTQEVFGFFKLKLPLYALAKGRLKIDGHPQNFTVKGILDLSEGSLYGENFDQGHVDLTVTRKKVLLRDVILQRGESRLAGKGEIRYDKHFSLTLEGHKLHPEEMAFLNKRFPDLSGNVELNVEGKGQFNKPVLKFRASFSNLHYRNVNMMKGRAKVNWIGHKVHFSAVFPERRLATSGSVHLSPKYPLSFKAQFADLRIDQLFQNHLSERLKEVSLLTSGKLSGSGTLAHLDTLNFSAKLSQMNADFGNFQLKNNKPLILQAKDGVLFFQQASFEGENTAISLNGSLSLLKRWDLFVKGEADLALLSYFSKEISSGNGKSRLDLSITDDWSSPRLRGQLTVNSGKIRLAHLSQSIGIDSMTALFNEQQLILENMDGQIGGGRFQLVGKARLDGFDINSFRLFLNLDHTRLIFPNDVPVTLSGELFFQRSEDQQAIKGDLHLLQLVYDKRVNLNTLVADFRKTGGDTLPTESDPFGKTALNIHLIGDQGLRVDNNVAKAALNIDLLLKGSLGKPILIGRIDVPKGDVFFLKNTFRVLSGSVDFLNTKRIDPTFNMEAVTEVRNVVTNRSYKIDLGLSGTTSQVTLSFNSFPGLPEDDILALLAIGKTASDLDQVKGGASTEAGNIAVSEFLSQSVNEISGVVGDPFEELTGTRLKVDPYISGTDSRTTTGTRLTAEKRLLDDQLLVVYSTTLDPNEEDLIKMVYEISKNVSLVGNRDDSGQVGGDLQFRFEFR